MRELIERIKNRIRISRSPESCLGEMPKVLCDVSKLGWFDIDWLDKIWADPKIANEWAVDSERIKSLRMPEMTGGVNPGDQRALYYLVRHLKPRRFLEIGTHIGSSTVALALAMARNTADGVDGRIITVDIRDVNCEESKPWLDAHSPNSPLMILKTLGLDLFVSFEVDTAVSRLQNATELYDVIFLDGDHSDTAVYSEIPLALKQLSPDGKGHVILHDYYPQMEPLWPGQDPLPGPYKAVEKFHVEGAGFDVLPFGELPWQTKLGGNKTSLAILTGRK
jgi:predicted O-methyltransferase YrrM